MQVSPRFDNQRYQFVISENVSPQAIGTVQVISLFLPVFWNKKATTHPGHSTAENFNYLFLILVLASLEQFLSHIYIYIYSARIAWWFRWTINMECKCSNNYKFQSQPILSIFAIERQDIPESLSNLSQFRKPPTKSGGYSYHPGSEREFLIHIWWITNND